MTDESKPRRGSRRLLARLSGRLTGLEQPLDPRVREAGLRAVARVERLLDRLDGVADTLQKVAEVELKVAQRLVPIVEDLGELVRHTLDEARERRGLPPRGGREGEPLILDHVDDEAP